MDKVILKLTFTQAEALYQRSNYSTGIKDSKKFLEAKEKLKQALLRTEK